MSGDGVRQAPVEDLQLPVRAFNSLRREGIHTVGDLAARNEADLLAINNLGPQSVSEIKQKLAERGLALAPATPGAGGDMAGAAPSAAMQAPAAPSLAARPPDEDAIDLLSVAGFPVLKRALPAVGVVAAFVLLVMLGRRAAAAGPAPPDPGGPGRGPAPPAACRSRPRRHWLARPPDEDAIDLLSVAGFPVLKRALPAVAVVAAFVLLLMLGRRRRSPPRSGAGPFAPASS